MEKPHYTQIHPPERPTRLTRKVALAVCRLSLLALLIPALPALSVAAANLNVNGTMGTDTPTCGTAAAPCKTITYTITTRATAGGTAINLAVGTYKEQLVIAADVAITGANEGATFIDGDGKAPIQVNTGVKLTLAKLTIQNGMASSGGGINNLGVVTLSHVTVTKNIAIANGGGIYNAGTLTGTDVTITANAGAKGGGGLYSAGKADLTRCAISANSAKGFGDGVYVRPVAPVAFSDCKISDHPTPGIGIFIRSEIGAVASAPVALTNTAITGNDGGVFLVDGTLIITGSTLSANTNVNILIANSAATLSVTNSTLSGSLVGARLGSGQSTFVNTTFANNIVALEANKGVTGSVTLQNTLLASTGANCDITLPATLTSQGHNASSDMSCGLTQPTDLSGAALGLSPLANNGGPTQTHALQPGSAALDKGGDGGNGCPATDQRGVKRPQGAACDIGAFEFTTTAPTVPTATPMAPTATPIMPTAIPPMMSPTIPMPSPTPVNLPTTAMTSPTIACTPLTPGSAFALAAFQMQWQAGEALAPNFWGPTGTGSLQEQYAESPSGQRIVQYFDKGRMEAAADGTVTNGLLANELISGQMQVGNGSFQTRAGARIPIAGDPDNAGPTYAQLGTTAKALFDAAPSHPGYTVTTTLDATGATIPGGNFVNAATMIAAYDSTTQHNVPGGFAQYRDQVGLLTIGYAKSEPFLAMVKVGGVPRQVMVQVFERRVLTYTPDNPDPYKVEMGNIGQHYYQWRYCTGT